MRALVTGADGFIGSHLVERLVGDGFEVRAFCVYNSQGSRGWLDGLDLDIEVRLGDVRDAGLVTEAVRGADVVFHLAALIAIPHSCAAPASFVDTDVSGTLNVLEAVRAHMVHTSTSEVYGTPRTVPITEGHPLVAQSPYRASKIAADKLCEAYARSFGVPVVTLRPFNTFGSRQSARAVTPTILGQLLAGAREVRLGNLEPRRDSTFVADTVDGFVRMARADLEPGEVVQLGTGRAVSVGELFDCCRQVTGADAAVVQDAQRVRPEVSLEDGLAATARWLRGRTDPVTAGRYAT